MNLSTRLRRSAHAPARTPAGRDPDGQPAPAQAAAKPVLRARVGAWWAVAGPWLMAGVVALALYLAYFTYDLLQNRLHDSSRTFQVTTHRFERYWVLYDAAIESTLALKWDLACPECVPETNALGREIGRFERDAAALRDDIAKPGLLMLSQAGNYDAAVKRLLVALREADKGGPDGTRLVALARQQAQTVLEQLTSIGQEARQQQSLAAVFRDEVEDVRRQVLLAFSGIVATLVLVVAMAIQWVAVARRERAIRARAEHLAEVAEAERARAENVMRDKSRFLGMLSHELLTPLQSIWSTMDVIESHGRVDAHEPAFTRLRESTRSLKARISDLVDFAKMSSGRLETRIRGFQLDKVIDAALRGVEEELAARNLDVHWESGPELAERVSSDPARLRQIVDNLLTNAVKYTERGGITIHAEIDRGAGTLRIEIADTGVGIQPQDLPRMFEPFYRGPSTAGMAEGSGLGLAVVRSLVDLMGGSIRFDSIVGQGTSVLLEVPIADADDGAAGVPVSLDLRRPVLIVDDSRDARRALADVIRALGVEVYEAGGGNAGLAEADERDYLAIILDMQMPDLTGHEVALRLRRPGSRHRKTFLVLISAFSDLDDETADAVFDARIDKPASRQDLVAVLARAARVAPPAGTSRG
jgi:signal transduction histidine kinase/CheY-like chemotaxis protein